MSLTAIVTLVLWSVCLVIGWLGSTLHYARPHAPAKVPEPVQAEILNVELTSDPLPPLAATPPSPDVAQPPPLLQPTEMPPAPPMTAVAAPSATVAFALPVEGPARIVEVKQASYARPIVPAGPAPVSAPPVQPLTFGQGEGRQPAPEYPYQAKRSGQEGTVGIRFSVGENGHVLAADAVSPSPWGLLNRAAVKVIRERWQFAAGPMRLYEVAIRFQLEK